MTTRRLRAVTAPPGTGVCAGCHKPMTVYEPGQTTHPNCDPVHGIPPMGGWARNTQHADQPPPEQARQLQLVPRGA